MINLMNMDEWKVPGEEKESLKEDSKKVTEESCACGRVVCCGKHKKGKCACSVKQKEHD